MLNNLLDTAITFLLKEDFSNAEIILKRIISNNSYDYKSFYYLAWIKEKTGDKEIAKKYYNLSKQINCSFFDIDEKIEQGQYFLENKNIELYNIIKWLIARKKYNEIQPLIAKINLEMAKLLINEKVSIKYAKENLYNKFINDLVKPYCTPLGMLIFYIGINLNLWGILHPWNYPKAFAYLLEISYAILEPDKFKKKLLKKSQYNYIEIEIIKRIRFKQAVQKLINMLFSNIQYKDNIINTLGLLKDKKAIFPLLRYLKLCKYEEVYQIILALCRLLDDKSKIPIIKKYIKKYINSELKPLLFVCFCRLEKGKKGLIELSNSKNIYIRQEAINQIADYKDKESIKIILQALFDNEKISDFYPVRIIAYDKIEEIGINYVKKINKNFENIKFFNEIDKVLLEDNPDILWLKEVIKSLT